MTPKIEQWMATFAEELWERNIIFKGEKRIVMELLASHAPSGLNRNDTVEYWMTRATTAELKLQEFAKVLDDSTASEAAAQPLKHLQAEQDRNYEAIGELVPEEGIEHNDH